MKKDENSSTWTRRLLKRTNWEKDKPIRLEGTSRKSLDL